jgi:hypothetical protein
MKNILFGSVVAAALIFSGCGSSSSTKTPADNNNTQGGGDNNNTQGGGDNNQTQGGGDNNQTQGGGDNNQTQGGGDTTATFNNLEWTALVPYDDNASISGKVTYNAATTLCTSKGMNLPTEAQIDLNTSTLMADVKFNFEEAVNSNGGSVLVVWIKDEGIGKSKGFAFDKGGDGYVYTNDTVWTNTDTNFVTCVK